MAFLKSFKIKTTLLITYSFYQFLTKFNSRDFYFYSNDEGLYLGTRRPKKFSLDRYVIFYIDQTRFYLNSLDIEEGKYLYRKEPGVYVFLNSTFEEVIEIDCYDAIE